MTSSACKKEQCQNCETYACKHPCHFIPPDEDIIDYDDFEDDGLDEDEDEMHLEDGEGEEDLF